MKHLRLLSVLLLLMAHQVLWAGPRTYRQAQAIAEKLAAQMGVSITPEAKARSFSGSPASASSAGISLGGSAVSGMSGSSASSSNQAYYIFPYGEGRGYAIVSGDDQMPEIVAYSDKGTFEEDKMSEGCREYLNAYKQVAADVAKGGASSLKLMQEKRSLMDASNYQQPTVEPLLGDINWSQDAPYNNLCPLNEEYQKRCYTGCVATAMAQVMRYWKYPASLQADIPAYTSASSMTGEHYEVPQIDKGVVYDWDNMLPTYAHTNHTHQQADAVATLMLHCGAAVNMQYSLDGSGSVLDPQVFVKYFGYDPDMVSLVCRNAYTFKEWCQLIDRELINKRPVLYAGISSTTGHQFVCDGADGNGLYHINWGWNGNSNGYFDIAILSPQGRGIGAGAGSNGYNCYARMVVGLQPDNGKIDEPLVTRGELTSAQEGRSLVISQADRTGADGMFNLKYNAIYVNLEAKMFRGYASVAVKDAQGNLQLIAEPKLVDGLRAPSNDGTLEAINVPYEISYAFPVGVTELYDVYSMDEGKTWILCNPDDDLRHLEVVATDTHLDLADETSYLKTTLQPEGDVIVQQDVPFSYTITNANQHDFMGTIYIFTSTINKCPDTPVAADYVDIEAGGSTTHSLTLLPNKSGKMYVWLYNVENDKVLVDGQEIDVKENENIKFKLLSKSINLKQDVFERELAYLQGYRVAMPVVDGDEAVVKYELQNNGPTRTAVNLPLNVTTYAADGDYNVTLIGKTCTLEGNGAVNELEYRFKAADLGEYPSFTCQLANNNLGLIDYSQIGESRIYLVDDDTYFSIFLDILYGYFDTDPTSITAAPTTFAGLQIMGGKGSLSIRADKAQLVDVYNLAGQTVRRLSLQAGNTTTVNLPSGIYVIGNKKVMVR